MKIIHFLILQKFASVPLKSRFKTKLVMRINSSIEVVYIWTIAGSLSDGFHWIPLVIAGDPWLPHGHFIWPRLQKIFANDG
jgi:hypothetical protein